MHGLKNSTALKNSLGSFIGLEQYSPHAQHAGDPLQL